MSMKHISLALLSFVLLAGCGERTPIDPAVGEKPAVTKPVSVDEWKAIVQQKETELRDAKASLESARIDVVQTKLWWFVGIMAFVALAGVALSIFVPAVARWALRASAASAAVAALAATVSWLLPWLVWIGGAVALIAGLAALWYWRTDAKSRDQVVKAVDAIKEQVPGFKAHFRQFIDEDADANLNATRVRLGLKPKDAP